MADGLAARRPMAFICGIRRSPIHRPLEVHANQVLWKPSKFEARKRLRLGGGAAAREPDARKDLLPRFSLPLCFVESVARKLALPGDWQVLRGRLLACCKRLGVLGAPSMTKKPV